MTDDAEDRALEVLRHDWGEFYNLGIGLDGFWARRHDGQGAEIRSTDPDELHRLLSADQAA